MRGAQIPTALHPQSDIEAERNDAWEGNRYGFRIR